MTSFFRLKSRASQCTLRMHCNEQKDIIYPSGVHNAHLLIYQKHEKLSNEYDVNTISSS